MKYFRDNEISIVQRNVVKVNQDIMIAQLRDLGALVKFQTCKAVFADNSPLLGGSGCHCGKRIVFDMSRWWVQNASRQFPDLYLFKMF